MESGGEGWSWAFLIFCLRCFETGSQFHGGLSFNSHMHYVVLHIIYYKYVYIYIYTHYNYI